MHIKQHRKCYNLTWQVAEGQQREGIVSRGDGHVARGEGGKGGPVFVGESQVVTQLPPGGVSECVRGKGVFSGH